MRNLFEDNIFGDDWHDTDALSFQLASSDVLLDLIFDDVGIPALHADRSVMFSLGD